LLKNDTYRYIRPQRMLCPAAVLKPCVWIRNKVRIDIFDSPIYPSTL